MTSGPGIVSGLGEPCGQFGSGTRSPGCGCSGQSAPMTSVLGAWANSGFARIKPWSCASRSPMSGDHNPAARHAAMAKRRLLG